jgi:hypothetical protein
MRTTAEPPPLEAPPAETPGGTPDAGETPDGTHDAGEMPDAGVIEEARARQHRHRGVAGAAVVAAGAIAAILLAFAGGGGGSRPGNASLSPGRAPSKSAGRPSPSSCQGKALQGPPSKSLLSILGVLRRPATAADAGSGITAQGFTSAVFVHYIRLTRIVDGGSYYIYPGIVGGCGTGEKAHEGIMHLAKNVDLGHGLVGGTGGGGASATDIEQGKDVQSGPPGSSTSETITMVVPDGVATVTLHYGPGPASGYTKKISPPFTITSPVINNELVVLLPRSVSLEGVPGVRMIWRAANGHVLETFDRL